MILHADLDVTDNVLTPTRLRERTKPLDLSLPSERQTKANNDAA